MAKVLSIVAGIPTFITVQSSLPTIYDQTTTLVADVTAGVAVTLPASQTYDSAELQVYRNGARLVLTNDFAYVGSAPRTQVTFVANLKIGDDITFRIMRNV